MTKLIELAPDQEKYLLTLLEIRMDANIDINEYESIGDLYTQIREKKEKIEPQKIKEKNESV